MAKIYEVDAERVVDLIRSADRDVALALLIGALKTAHEAERRRVPLASSHSSPHHALEKG